MILYAIATGHQMDPPANSLFARRKPIDLSDVKNLALRQLIASCFGAEDERPTILQIREQLTTEMFCAAAIQQAIPAAQVRSAEPIAKSVAPPAAALNVAKSPAVSQAPASPIPAAPAGCDADFNQKWEPAHRGDAAAQLWIGRQFLNGSSGVEQDFSAAASWFQKSAEGGDISGMNSLGRCYGEGLGVEQDFSAAFSWFQKSAEGENIWAMFELARCYWNGLGVEQDWAMGESWCRKADGQE